jgi:hypothetical protein
MAQAGGVVTEVEDRSDELREWYAEDDLPADDDRGDDDATTWEPLDLGPWLRGEIENPTPTLGLARSDGLRLIYPGREHAVLGETESGKTWLALGCVAAELSAGNHVVYFHYEEGDPGSTIERLRLLCVADSVIQQQFRFVAPAKPIRLGWIDSLLDPAPTLVVHDGVNEAMALHGADIMAADGASAFRRALIIPCTRTGAATLACDHLPKDREGRGRDAYGSVHKGNALDGARIVLENTKPFGRRLQGISYVFVTKDRPGHLRNHGRPSNLPGKTFMGTLFVDDSQTFGPDFSMRFSAPKDDDNPSPVNGSTLVDDVHDVIAALPGRTVPSAKRLYAEMRKAGHQVRENAIRDAIEDLTVADRLIEVLGKRGAKGYQAVLTSAQGVSGSDLGPDLGPDLSPLKGGPGAEVTSWDLSPVGGLGGPRSAEVGEEDDE